MSEGQLSLPGSVNEYQLWLGRQRQVWLRSGSRTLGTKYILIRLDGSFC